MELLELSSLNFIPADLHKSQPCKFVILTIMMKCCPDEKDRFVVFISGLELSDRNTRCLPSAQLAVDWIVGEAGEMDDQVGRSS